MAPRNKGHFPAILAGFLVVAQSGRNESPHPSALQIAENYRIDPTNSQPHLAHKIMRPWFYYSIKGQNLSVLNDLYWQCTSFEKAFGRGGPLNILHDS